jgi:hypothetical protein
MRKKSSPHPSPKNLKGKKKQGTLSACLGLPIIGGMKFSLHKRVHHHFRPGLIPLAKNTQNKSLYVLLYQNFKRKA